MQSSPYSFEINGLSQFLSWKPRLYFVSHYLPVNPSFYSLHVLSSLLLLILPSNQHISIIPCLLLILQSCSISHQTPFLSFNQLYDIFYLDLFLDICLLFPISYSYFELDHFAIRNSFSSDFVSFILSIVSLVLTLVIQFISYNSHVSFI